MRSREADAPPADAAAEPAAAAADPADAAELAEPGEPTLEEVLDDLVALGHRLTIDYVRRLLLKMGHKLIKRHARWLSAPAGDSTLRPTAPVEGRPVTADRQSMGGRPVTADRQSMGTAASMRVHPQHRCLDAGASPEYPLSHI